VLNVGQCRKKPFAKHRPSENNCGKAIFVRLIVAGFVALPLITSIATSEVSASDMTRWSLGIICGLILGAVTWLLLPGRGIQSCHPLLMVLITVGLLFVFQGEEFSIWAAPLSLPTREGKVSLVLSFSLLTIIFWILQDCKQNRNQLLGLLLLSSFFIFSLICGIAIALFSLAFLLVLRQSVIPSLPVQFPFSRFARSGLPMILSLILSGSLSIGWVISCWNVPPAPMSRDLETLTRQSYEEGNRFRALYFVKEWLRKDKDSSDRANLMMARIVWSFQEADLARQLASRVKEQGKTIEIRNQAEKLLSEIKQ